MHARPLIGTTYDRDSASLFVLIQDVARVGGQLFALSEREDFGRKRALCRGVLCPNSSGAPGLLVRLDPCTLVPEGELATRFVGEKLEVATALLRSARRTAQRARFGAAHDSRTLDVEWVPGLRQQRVAAADRGEGGRSGSAPGARPRH